MENNNNTYFILTEPKDKPIKIIIEDNVKVTSNGNVIEIKKHLCSMEAEKLLNDIFGTTNIAVLDCSDITDEEIDRIVEKFNSIPEVYPITTEDLEKVLKRSKNESD